MTSWSFLALVLAGGAGAGLRYLLDGLVMHRRPHRFPLGILLVNVSGAFLLGVVTGLGASVLGDVATIVGVGLLGGYTTFSTVSVETVLLAQRRRRTAALMNVFGTALLSLAAAGIGLAVTGAVL